MKLLTSIIDLDSIQVREASFSPEQKKTEITALANTIVDLGGSVSLPVVQQINLESYELISGYLEYYAYIKAREINPQLPDRIMVFVADNKNHVALHQQLSVLQSIESAKLPPSDSGTSNASDLELKTRNLEALVSNNHRLIVGAIAQLKTELIEEITAKLPKPIPPLLDAFNRILEPEIAHQVQRKLEFLGSAKAKKIVSRLQEVSKSKKRDSFQSFSDVLDALKPEQSRSRLMSEARMLDLIDRWNG